MKHMMPGHAKGMPKHEGMRPPEKPAPKAKKARGKKKGHKK